MGHETDGTESPLNRLFGIETLRKHCKEIIGADYRWEQQGFPHMGELPPLHTPQGPGVPRAFRPGFPRVDSSGTSSAPSSRSASFPFLASSSLHFAHLLSPGAFPPPSRSPLPSPSLRPVLSTFRYSFLHGSLRPCPLVFPSASFPFLPLPCVRFPSVFPLRSSHRFQVRSPPPSTRISSG